MRKHTDVLCEVLLEAFDGSPRVGAEIGVASGRMSAALLSAFQDLRLVMVDPWRCPDAGSTYADDRMAKANPSQDDWDAMRKEALRITDFAATRRQVMRVASSVASKLIDRGSLDFAFIDADHSYSAVSLDITLWLPKVRGGGILAGHDYTHSGFRAGVGRAVDEYVGRTGVELHLPGAKVWWFHVPQAD